MQRLIRLFTLLSIAAATPLTTNPALDNRSSRCQNITITRVTVSGDNCPAIGRSYIQTGDLYKNDASINFDNFNTALETSPRISMATVTCTVNVDLAYPLPVASGCSNNGEFFIREKGNLQLQTTGDSLMRNTAVSFSNGPSARFLAASLPLSWTQQNKRYIAPYWDDFIDERRSKFFFASPGSSSGDGSSRGYQPIGTMKIDLTLTLTGKGPSLASLDSFDIGVETVGTW